MTGIGNKALLFPIAFLHRPHDPSGENADQKEDHQKPEEGDQETDHKEGVEIRETSLAVDKIDLCLLTFTALTGLCGQEAVRMHKASLLILFLNFLNSACHQIFISILNRRG
jgi:hypothetical protein